MNKWENIWFLIIGFFLFSVSIIVLQVGRILYGTDATLLWAMGILCFMSLQGIVGIFVGSIKNKKQEDRE